MKKRFKKGFTLVELLVVIGILAVLAVVSVVGYFGFIKKANVSNDISLTTQMNTILQAEEAGGETFDTPHEAVQALRNGGLDITKLTPSANGYNYVYDLKSNRMFLLDENKNKVAPSNLEFTGNENEKFAFVSNKAEVDTWTGSKYSVYLKNNFDTTTLKDTALTVACSIDVGDNKVNVKYEDTVNETVILRTNGGNLTVNNTNTSAVQKHYGAASEVSVTTATNCFDTYGAISKLEIEEGKVTLQEGAVAFLYKAKNDTENNKTVDIEQKGGVVYIPSDAASEVSKDVAEKAGYTYDETNNKVNTNSKTTGYEIDSLTGLERFRDLVNGGFEFKGLTVELKSDITLKDGWTPIGENGRKVVKETYNSTFNKDSTFRGTFKGNGHTISNLNANGYVPGKTAQDEDGYKFVYGFFGTLTDDSVVENLKLTNVNIDVVAPRSSSDYKSVTGDSVGALVGYCEGNPSISNITVSGSVKGLDAVGGIVGRWYGITNSLTIEGVKNNATINSTKKGAGIVGYIYIENTSSGDITFKNCENTANITSTTKYADAIATNASWSNLEKYKIEGCKNSGTISSHKDNSVWGLYQRRKNN